MGFFTPTHILMKMKECAGMIKEHSLQSRLERLIRERDTNARRLAGDAGLNQTAIRDILKGRSLNPRHDTVQKIAAALNVSVGYLLGTDADSRAPKDVAAQDTVQNPSINEHNAFTRLPNYVSHTQQPTDGIPVYGYAAGSGSLTAKLEENHIVEYRPRHDSLRGVPNAFYVSVIGDSMYPRFKPGELVAVHPNKLPQPGDDCLFIDEDGDAHIKEFVSMTDGGITVMQWNPQQTRTLNAGEYSRLCTIVGTAR